jgi:hemolysin activation/secretion protein
MDRSRHLLLGFVVLPLAAAVAQAQAPPDPARAADQIQREQQEQQRRQLEEQRRELPPPDSGVPVAEAEASTDDGGPCRQIDRIAISSSPNLTDRDRAQIARAYEGRCLRVRDIEQLLADITNAYIRRGYVTTRVYLPEQDLSRGELSVMVVEGVVERIALSGEGAERIALGSALPGVEGKPLNLRDLEQGLDQINRLQSNRATLDIQPGETAGTSRIVVRNEAARSFRFGATADDTGQDATGKHQAGVTASLDSPFGLNDYVTATYRRSLPLESRVRESELGSVTYLVPYGYNTLSLAFSRSDYLSFVTAASGARIPTEGRSDLSQLRFERVAYRSRDDRVTLSATLTARSADNYVAGQLIGVNSRNLSVLDLNINYSTGFLRGVLSLDAGVSRGLPIFGAPEDPDGLASDAPRAQFRKFNFAAGYSLPFRVVNRDASFASSLIAQHARTPLYGSEQMLVGGLYSVRGFQDAGINGDHGFFLRNELAVRQPLAWAGATLRPFVAVDWGRARMLDDANELPEGALSGFAGGVSLGNEHFMLELFTTKPWHVPAFMQREDSQTYFRFSTTL